ncbi:MAG: MFS transporter [Streptosporangiaceae bacterium]
MMRPVGGRLSDRFSPVRVLAVALGVVAAAAVVQAFTSGLVPVGTIAFLSMAPALGAGAGATFALVAMLAPADKVGSVTGVVGAAGGLGGFVPPLVMGLMYQQFGSYAGTGRAVSRGSRRARPNPNDSCGVTGGLSRWCRRRS